MRTHLLWPLASTAIQSRIPSAAGRLALAIACTSLVPPGYVAAAPGESAEVAPQRSGLTQVGLQLLPGNLAEVGSETPWDIVIATVDSVDDENATNGNPPRLTLTIHAVLRGDLALERRQARWPAPPHGIDTINEESNRRLRQWSETPLKGPRPGASMILAGQVQQRRGDETGWFWIYDDFEDTAANRRLAEKGIQQGEDRRRAREQEERQAEQAHDSAMAEWRQSVSDEMIRELTAQADFVAIGFISSGPSTGGDGDRDRFTFEIRQVLKGEKVPGVWKGDSYFVAIDVTDEISDLLYPSEGSLGRARGDFLLFLDLQTRSDRTGHPVYTRVPVGDGLVEADERAVQVVRSADR